MEVVRMCQLENLPLMEGKKIAPVEKCTGPKELLDYFIQLFGQFPYHSILTKWQRDQLYSLFENLPLDQAICISDYSRGFACRF